MARAPPVPSPLEPNPGDTTCKRRRYQRTQRTFLTQIRPTLRVTRREKPAHYTHAPSHCKHLHCTGTRHMKTTTAHTRQPHTTRSSQISRRTRRAAHNEQHTAAHNPQSSTFLGTQPKASDGSRTRPEATPCRFSTRINSTRQFSPVPERIASIRVNQLNHYKQNITNTLHMASNERCRTLTLTKTDHAAQLLTDADPTNPKPRRTD